MTAIDLSRDLELMYEFDSNYFDSQRNVIQDQSGYGRHAVASGGPTVGVEGPNDFEVASFDGTDDIFDPNYGLNVGNSFTFFAFYKNLQSEVANIFGDNSFKNGGVALFDAGGGSRLELAAQDDSGTRVQQGLSQEIVNEWTPVVAGVDNGTLFVLTDSLKFSTETSLGSFTSNTTFKIGRRVGGNYHRGSIAKFGHWSRRLSNAEIQYLFGLTAPRRSQL